MTVYDRYAIKDNAESTLATSLTTGGLSLTVASGEGSNFAEGASVSNAIPMVLTIRQYNTKGDPTSGLVKQEKILVSVNSSDIMTIVERGVGNTSPQSFEPNDSIYLFWTEDFANGLYAEMDVIGRKNYAYNPDGLIHQRINADETQIDSTTTQTNNDGNYIADRWILLSDGNDIVDYIPETTDVPTGHTSAMKFQVETANKKFGICQIFRKEDIVKLIGNEVSLSVQAHTTSGQLENVRMAVLAWDGTKDSPTKDVVNTWEAEGSNPTLATNWYYENTPSDLALTDSYQTLKVEGVSLDQADTENIAIFIWVDDTDGTVDDELFISDVQFCEGSFIRNTIRITEKEEWDRCLAYFVNVDATYSKKTAGVGYAQSSSTLRTMIPVSTRMVGSPTEYPTIPHYSGIYVVGNGSKISVTAAFQSVRNEGGSIICSTKPTGMTLDHVYTLTIESGQLWIDTEFT